MYMPTILLFYHTGICHQGTKTERNTKNFYFKTKFCYVPTSLFKFLG